MKLDTISENLTKTLKIEKTSKAQSPLGKIMKKIGLNIGDNTGVYLNNLLRPLEEIKKPPIYSAEQTRDDKRLQVPEKITSQTP